MQLYALSLHSWSSKVVEDQTFEGSYVTSIAKNKGEEAVDNWSYQFLQQNVEKLWSQYEEILQYWNKKDTNVGDLSIGQDEAVVEDQNNEPMGKEEVKDLEESNYKMDQEPVATT